MSLILCFGNPLHGDDALGWHVFNRLNQLVSSVKQAPVPTVRFGGISPLDAVSLLEGESFAVIVDALQPSGTPGRVASARVTGAHLSTDHLSLHRFSVADTLAAMKAEGLAVPDIELVTVEAESVTAFDMELSESVARAVEPASLLALDLALAEDSRSGSSEVEALE